MTGIPQAGWRANGACVFFKLPHKNKRSPRNISSKKLSLIWNAIDWPQTFTTAVVKSTLPVGHTEAEDCYAKCVSVFLLILFTSNWKYVPLLGFFSSGTQVHLAFFTVVGHGEHLRFLPKNLPEHFKVRSIYSDWYRTLSVCKQLS